MGTGVATGHMVTRRISPRSNRSSAALSGDVIPLAAAFAAQEPGDDRKAIDILRHAGEVANGESANTIGEEHVYQA